MSLYETQLVFPQMIRNIAQGAVSLDGANLQQELCADCGSDGGESAAMSRKEPLWSAIPQPPASKGALSDRVRDTIE